MTAGVKPKNIDIILEGKVTCRCFKNRGLYIGPRTPTGDGSFSPPMICQYLLLMHPF
jgi:hypothetical protein